MKKLLFILMSVLAFLGWSTVCAQDYSAEFKDAEGMKSAFGEQNFTLAGKSWYATCGYYDNSAKDHFRLGRRTKDSAVAAKIESKFTSLGISEKGAVLEMKWDFENITAFNIVSSYNWDAGTKVFLLISTDGGTTYEILKTETIAEKDPSGAIVERIFSDGVAREKARYALALEGAKEGQCRLNLTKVFTNKRGDVDETAPEVDKILTKSTVPTAIEVYFNEAVTKASAEAVANYRIEGLAVTAAALAEGDKMVTLTTAAMTAGTEYTLVINGVEDAAGNKMENVSTKFSFGYAEVADLAALCAMRETYVEGQKYLVKGELVITAIVGKNGSNQTTTNAWVQDKGCDKAVGHSMMLYYVNNLFPETAKIGDVISGLVGELTVYNDLIEMQYFDTAMIEFTGETAEVTVDDVTIDQLKGSDKLQYQNAMVRIKDVMFADGGKFEANKSYKVTDGTTNIDVRTNREGSYLGETIPSKNTNVVGYVGYYSGNCQISPRMKEDINNDPTANENRADIEYAVYPNPTSGILNVEVAGDFHVSVYNLNGVQLMRRAATGKIQADLSKLAQGVYVVEISTAKGMVYTKVVVR